MIYAILADAVLAVSGRPCRHCGRYLIQHRRNAFSSHSCGIDLYKSYEPELGGTDSKALPDSKNEGKGE